MNRRSDILGGVLTFPEQIRNLVNPTDNEEVNALIEEFWSNIFHNFLREKSCDTITWFIKFNNPVLFNTLLMHLSKGGWITSESNGGNHAFITLNESKLLKWVTEEELVNLRFRYKFLKYRLQKTKSTLSDIVQINGKHMPTGLVREGFMKAGNNTFKYDTKYLKKYLYAIAKNIKKGLVASTKDITYQEIIDELLNYYSVDGTEYTLGNCYIDSRGRSIFQCSKKVFNPVSHKDARALLICKAEPLTTDGWNCIYAAISELLGYYGKDIEDKIKYGKAMYITRELPSIEEMEYNDNYEDLHIRIMLERIYDNIDTYDDTGWMVPIELDALASLIELMAVLTNDYEYMKRTNMIGTKFDDIWTVPYCSRNHIKKALTPKLYGSNQHTKALWDKNKLEYTQIQLNKVSEDLSTGIYANANNFKDFIIGKVQPQERMKVKVFNEEFWIECNRFKWEETCQINYAVYTSAQGLLKKITRTVSLVPDLKQFKRFMVTCLLHNLDSQIANKVCLDIDWVISNHDSWTIHPNDAYAVRKSYTDSMYCIYENRHQILEDYFKSIGINEKYEEMKHDNVITEFSPYCLK